METALNEDINKPTYIQMTFYTSSQFPPQMQKTLSKLNIPYLTYSAVEAGLNMVFAFITGIDESILALVVQLYQHTHGTPFGPP